MPERIPRTVYDKLASSIWDLSKVHLRRYIEMAPLPSDLKGEIEEDGVCLEPEVTIATVAQQSLRQIPRYLGLMVSSVDTYEPDSEMSLYTWRRVALDTQRYSRTFDSGVLITNCSGIDIRPNWDNPAPWRNRRPGSQDWRTMHGEGNIGSFGIADALEFIDLARDFTTVAREQARRESD